jgi:hypothetical protein
MEQIGKRKATYYSKNIQQRGFASGTHLTTNPPVHCLYMAERTGSLALKILWSYVGIKLDNKQYIKDKNWKNRLSQVAAVKYKTGPT